MQSSGINMTRPNGSYGRHSNSGLLAISRFVPFSFYGIWQLHENSQVQAFPENEVRKGQLTMELKKLKETQEKLAWPSDSNDLPVISWESCMSFSVNIKLFNNLISIDQEQSQKRSLILISGFIHDVGSFIDEHPGGPHLLIKFIGKDASTAFFGGVYDHSNAAHNVCVFMQCLTIGLTDCNSCSR